MPNLVEIFNDTTELCRTDPELKKTVEKSLAEEYFLPEREELELTAEIRSAPAEIVVSRKRSFEAAKAYKGKKVCVLNFASSRNPGGGVVNGAVAQEECLCRISTLYPCLASSKMFRSFYEPHRTMFSDTLYNSDLIFTPGVRVFKTDTAAPELRPRGEWFSTDVITCAAPNLRHGLEINDQSLEALHISRGERIFITAANEGADVLILGAFGCGAFRNPPEVVAKAYRLLTEKYAMFFETIEFAVYCSSRSPQNYETFKSVLL